MDYIPDENKEYANVEYWNNRYETEDTYEWFKGYQEFREIIAKFLKPGQRILMLGCGNSRLSEDMYNDGYHHITNVDYSPIVIEKMKHHCPSCSAMDWLVADARNLNFPPQSFHAVVEKGMLDAMLATEKNPWNISKETGQTMDSILRQISQILQDGGHFISISFSQPHFRRRLCARPGYGWSFDYHTFGTTFQYYVYVMVRGNAMPKEEVKGTQTSSQEVNATASQVEDSTDFLCRICPD